MAAMRGVFADRRAAWRALGWFWAAVAAVLVIAALVVQTLGPPHRTPLSPPKVAASPTPPRPTPAPQPKAAPLSPAFAAAFQPGRDTPGPIAAPDPALLEASTLVEGGMLPRISRDGRRPSQVYARGFDRSSRRPRIGILLAGVGLNEADSEEAIRTLPGGITLAFSPYAAHSDHTLDEARLAEHEFLISIPMEPNGYPLNDAGDHALLTGLAEQQNRERLEWVLTRIRGYVGATNAFGAIRGERFASAPAEMAIVLQTLAARGLLYVDARPGQPNPPFVWGRSVDVIIDEPAVRTEIETKLAQLEQIARDKGSALGLAGAVRPVTIDRLAAWAQGVEARGFALAPVSALTQPPPEAAQK